MAKENERSIMGKTISRLRKANGLTQSQIAGILNIKRSTYAYYESNITPTTDIIKKLSLIFGVTIHELMYGEPEMVKRDEPLRDESGFWNSPRMTQLAFSQLSGREKEVISRFRLLPENLKEKFSKELEEMLDKLEG